MTAFERYDAVVVGAGFAGLYMLHRLRKLGLSVRVIEAGTDVGGTWYWNRYPGARCDVESLEYGYQFDPELQQSWSWSERYAAQPEILDYIRHVADRFDLRRDIMFGTRVDSAHFDDGSNDWRVITDRGARYQARFCIMATGCLSVPTWPDISGADTFAGETYHTGRWPHEGVDFTGQRVGVIGTGSSAIQSIPIMADQAAELFVFQRTPNFSVPAQNEPMDRELEALVKANYADFRARNGQMQSAFGARHPRSEASALEATEAERQRQFEHHWQLGGLLFLRAYGDLLVNPEANELACEFIRDKIRSIVRDPQVSEKLLPDSVVGCKRLCADTGYFETFNRPHVHLVDLRESPIECITPEGIRQGGQDYPLDALVFATGFDAMTGALARIDIRGRKGVALSERWEDGPKTYLGLQVAGFPNLFTITGPGSPSVLTNMLYSIEQHVDWISDCVDDLRRTGLTTIEPAVEAETAWVEHVNEMAGMTLFTHCNSWYLGANVPGKPRVFMPYLGFPEYVARCNEIRERGYEGFVFG
ncbi:MAG: NAD(P)/FAD-dependent oxidoreductase [Gammaproteobacteria bacterium]|nr:NAD(P)/FAD-dependent oxidoreductase [Gammaproteobacteria bacterium]